MTWLPRNSRREGIVEAERIGIAQNVDFHARENGMCRATLNRSTWDFQSNAHFVQQHILGEISLSLILSTNMALNKLLNLCLKKYYFINFILAAANQKMLRIQGQDGLAFWQCSECAYNSKKSTDVRKHVERLDMDLKYYCSHCELTFRSMTDLKSHSRRVHPESISYWIKLHILKHLLLI